MDTFPQDLATVGLVGIGATATLDLWQLALARFGVPASGFGLVGRWVGHGLRGRWRHRPITQSPPIRGELALGWAVHYATGIAFAGLLPLLFGRAWLVEPSLGAALAVGVGSVAAPLLVMQPAMGAKRNVPRSLVNHAVFGAGLYLAAILLSTLKGMP